MGFPPREVKLMTFWEYMVCVRGWNKANGGGESAPMTDEDYDALCRLGDMWNGGSSSRP